MGAQQFFVVETGRTPKDAFQRAVLEAGWEHGHGGYTGTVAEKESYTVIPVPPGEDPLKYAEALLDEGDRRVDDKWGPAGCIQLGPEKYLFFGWASS